MSRGPGAIHCWHKGCDYFDLHCDAGGLEFFNLPKMPLCYYANKHTNRLIDEDSMPEIRRDDLFTAVEAGHYTEEVSGAFCVLDDSEHNQLDLLTLNNLIEYADFYLLK